jgi:hypothetical protein
LPDKRHAVGVGADEPIFGTANGMFRDHRTVTRWLVEARERHGVAEWMIFHAWRKTTGDGVGRGWCNGANDRRPAGPLEVR